MRIHKKQGGGEAPNVSKYERRIGNKDVTLTLVNVLSETDRVTKSDFLSDKANK